MIERKTFLHQKFYHLQYVRLSDKAQLATCNSYNMGKRDLPDVYAQARGPQARGRGHIYQENPECPCYN